MNNILEGIRPSASRKNSGSAVTKFVIKSKPTTSHKQNRSPAQTIQLESLRASNQDVDQFFIYMLGKSKRYRQLMEQKNVMENWQKFIQKHLYGSLTLRTIMKGILDKMLADRRIGKNLKGINRDLLSEIQNNMWSSLEREVTLFKINEKYQTEKQRLKLDLYKRTKQIQHQLRELNGMETVSDREGSLEFQGIPEEQNQQESTQLNLC